MLWLLAALAQNASFSVPVPDGYRDVSIKGAIVLMHGTPGAADAAAINFVPGEHHPEHKNDDAKECATFAEEFREHQHASAQRSAIVDGPTGKTCQVILQYKEQNAQVISTIVRGTKDTWVMTCAMRPSDTAAERQCSKTLGAIKFK